MSFEFVILMVSQFNSGFAKPDFSNTNIVFPSQHHDDKIKKFGEVISAYQTNSASSDKFFYIFYKRNNESNSAIDKEDLCTQLLIEFIK